METTSLQICVRRILRRSAVFDDPARHCVQPGDSPCHSRQPVDADSDARPLRHARPRGVVDRDSRAPLRSARPVRVQPGRLPSPDRLKSLPSREPSRTTRGHKCIVRQASIDRPLCNGHRGASGICNREADLELSGVRFPYAILVLGCDEVRCGVETPLAYPHTWLIPGHVEGASA